MHTARAYTTLALAVGALILAAADTVLSADLEPEQVHIALGERPDQMTVMWSTWESTYQSLVQFGTESQELTSEATGSWQTLVNGLLIQYIHNVKLQGLKTGTKYWYRCGNGQVWSAVYSFTTLQDGVDWSPRIALYGDLGYREGSSAHMLTSEALMENIDVILHNGDLAYDLHTDSGRVGDNFMNMIQPFAARIPYMVSVGNHEAFNWNYTNYKTRFDMPGTPDNLWYSFKVGPIHFVVMSTEVYFFLLFGGMGAVQSHYQWLQNTLMEANLPENREKWPWVIALGHRPMYCSNTALRYCRLDSNPVRVGLFRMYGLEDLLFKHGVDLAFWGHNHCYERLWPTYNGEVYNGSTKEPYRNPRATIHVTSGVAGNQEGTSNFRGTRGHWSAFASTERGYTRLTAFNRSHLYFEQISTDKDGDVIDKVWVVKDSHESFLRHLPGDKKKRRFKAT